MMNSDDIRHIRNKHGDPIMEAARGQVGVTPEDIARIPEILANPDRVYISEELDGKDRLVIAFEKNFGDKLITFQGISMGKHLLQTDTLYVQKGRTRRIRNTMYGEVKDTAPVINAQSEPQVRRLRRRGRERKGKVLRSSGLRTCIHNR